MYIIYSSIVFLFIVKIGSRRKLIIFVQHDTHNNQYSVSLNDILPKFNKIVENMQVREAANVASACLVLIRLG